MTTPQRRPLWNNHAPIGDGRFEQGDAWITVHRAPAGCGTAVVICPGGGYHKLMTEPEGHGIAAWLNRYGVTGVVLEYRLPAGRHCVPLLDAQRALRTVRAQAAVWEIDPTRVGIMGFSAGGHVASTAATWFDDGEKTASQHLDRESCRPDFLMLVYPVVTMGEKTHQRSRESLLGIDPPAALIERYSNEKQVTARTPPAFLAHAGDDESVPPDNSRDFHAALRRHNVLSRYVELPSGGHGLDGYQGPMWDAWQFNALDWLAEMKFSPSVNVTP